MRIHACVCVQRISVALKRLQEAWILECNTISMACTNSKLPKPEGSYVGTCIAMLA